MSDVTVPQAERAGLARQTGDRTLKREVGLSGLTLVSLGSIIGSGWLLGTLGAAKVAGPASIVSWVLAGLILGLLALVHAELGSTYPVSGGTARFPYMAFGALGGFTGGWMAWIQAVTIAPIEVEASLGYIDGRFKLGLANTTTGVLTSKGIALGAAFMLFFVIINILGVKWLAETNSIATYWKIAIPTITIFALLFTVFHTSNFTAGGGFMPFGVHGIFAALPAGIVFALQGFEQAIQVGGEARNPQRDIPRAVIGAMIIGTLIYLLLSVAFIGALEPGSVAHNWLNPISAKAGGVTGPYASLATLAGLGWLATLLYIDAVVSPAGTGLLYVGTSSRLSYGLGRNKYFPRALDKVSRRGVPVVSIIIAFVVGMLVFLPFPSWYGLVGLVTSATVLMYGMAPPTLGALRRSDPDRQRSFRLPAAGVLSPLSFVCANLIVYWAGWSTLVFLYMLIAVGFVIFGLYQWILPAERRSILDWRAASWIVPWLAGLAVISWQGQYPAKASVPTIFGLTLPPTYHIPFWWDLLVVAVFSVAIHYWAVRVAMPAGKVAEAVADVEAEAGEQSELTLAG